MTRFVVVADDVTGAADAAGAFAARGHSADLWLGSAEVSKVPLVDVVAVDTDSRARAADEAGPRTRAAIGKALDSCPAADVFVKIDSTGRGHVRETVGAALDEVRSRGGSPQAVVCPALPVRGRTVVDGAILVGGLRLDVPALTETFHGVDATVFDATTDADLDALVSEPAEARQRTIWVGSAGLAAALARATPPAASSTVDRSARAPSAIVRVLAGSMNEVTGAQVALLDPAIVMTGDPRVFHFGSVAAAWLADADGMILTGGATARAALEGLGINRLGVGGEVEPGIPWLVDPISDRVIITKAGGFGDPFTLVRAVAWLHAP